MKLRKIARTQLNQAGDRLQRMRGELGRVEREPALFQAELITAARNRVIEAMHSYSRANASWRAICC